MKLLTTEVGQDFIQRPGSSKFRTGHGGSDENCVLKNFAKMQSRFYEKILTY